MESMRDVEWKLPDDAPAVNQVLDAIDHLLDAMEGFEAPITRDLLRTAMMALVHECRLPESPVTRLN
jgi:hypothetical protein